MHRTGDREIGSVSPASDINPYTGVRYSEKYYKILKKREELPVFAYREKIVQAILDNSVVIIEGQTGSGKTTQIPQFILESSICPPTKKIICTQPRRVAAISVANRVADEMDVMTGDTVGYKVRFDSNASDQTRLIYMTDGILMRDFIIDPLVNGYGVIVIDEAHERTVNTDIVLGLLSLIHEHRPELKVVVMSATLDARKFVDFFTKGELKPPHIIVPGRMYDVKLFYEPDVVQNYVNEAIRKCMSICQKGEKGDVLIFMTGEDEIENLCNILRDKISALRREKNEVLAEVLPIFANLPTSEQQKVFQPLPEGYRKIVVATNIAETSVTIDGIVYVIDSGYVKEMRYSPKNRKSSLNKTIISRASADQRKGRAGRTQEGFCYRLYPEKAYNNDMRDQTVPEIQRSNLCDLILQMLAAHVRDIAHFPYLDLPHHKLLLGSLEELYHLGAFRPDYDLSLIGKRDELSEVGHIMSMIPVEPKYARSLIAAAKYNCSIEVVSLIALLNDSGNVFRTPRNKRVEADAAHKPFMDPSGDHMTLLRVLLEYEKQGSGKKAWCLRNFIDSRTMETASRVKNQLINTMKGLKIWSESPDNRNLEERIFISLITGSFMDVARRSSNDEFKIIISEVTATISKYSALYISDRSYNRDWILYDSFVSTGENALRTTSYISPDWMFEAAPSFFVPELFPQGAIRESLKEALREYRIHITK